MRACAVFIAAIVVSGLLAGRAVFADAEGNLLRNPDLRQGSGNQPSYWTNQRLRKNTGSFTWMHGPEMVGELQVSNRAFDLAQWSESLTLEPGWYRLSGEVETQLTDRGGSVMLGARHGPFASGWNPGTASGRLQGEFYFKVSSDTRQVEIVCGLTGAGSASFRNLRLVRVAVPPLPQLAQADFGALAARRRQQEERVIAKPYDKPTGSLWTEIVLMAGLATTAAFSWRALA